MELLGKIALSPLLLIVFFSGVCFSESGTGNTRVRDNHQISLAVSEKPLADGVTLHLEFSNQSGNTINLFFVSHFLKIKAIVDAQETELSSTVLPKMRISKEDVYQLLPKGVLQFDVPVARQFYKWPHPGIHSLYVIYQNKSESVDGVRVWVGKIKSNVISVEF